MNRSLVAIVLLLVPSSRALAQSASDANEFFEKEVRPLLVERCLECHGAKEKPKGGLRLTTREAVIRGGDSGPAAVAGKPDESLLIQAVRYLDEPRMPPKAKLSDREIAILTTWVQRGLPWPETKAAPAPADPKAASSFRITDEQRRFWSFQPIRDVPAPAVKDERWCRSAIDRFILAPLEAQGLHPVAEADRRTLIRRATFDLTGLPPSPEEVTAFVEDPSPDAFARVVDRLLGSRAYGVRWGRHWLDVVRYTDSFDARGVGGEMDCADAWRYRDWVVDAFNRDLPYNEFVTQQVAGDLVASGELTEESLQATLGTGMLAIGNWGGGDADKEKLLTDIADDQVDVVSRAFLGLTVACARCHDHKFDPISTKDYYGLAGIFFSTHILPNVGPKTNGPPMMRIPLETKAEKAQRAEYAQRLSTLESQLKKRIEDEKTTFARGRLAETARYVTAAWEFQSQAGSAASASLAEFARRAGLHEFALRQWIGYLGLAGRYPLMDRTVRDVLGRPGIVAWKGAADCPSFTVNTTNEKVTLSTFTLPARSVAVHPGPRNGVVVSWRSPIDGVVNVSGRLADADAAGGDGIAWVIEHRHGLVGRALASGAFANGGNQAFAAASLNSIEVRRDDLIQLLVLPNAEYTCDTTHVEMVVAQADGPAKWDLAADVLGDPLAANPHADRQGHAGIWSFEDMADRARPGAGSASAAGPLAAWQRAVSQSPEDRSAVESATREFAKAFDVADSSSPFWIQTQADEAALGESVATALASLRSEVDALKKSPPPPLRFANGAQEGGVPGSPHEGVHDVRVHIRGSYARLGDLVPRHFPEILAGDSQPTISAGSGRKELAEWLASPSNALTARVIVNRVWQHHFGRGIVPTASNFGKLGERPTHPELLDALAHWFIANRWSFKRLHREIMLSSAYRQSSQPSADMLQADPGNRLFGRMNRQRLESEAIRDSLLAVAGRLDPSLGGPAVRDFGTPRRTLYLMTIRSDRSGFGPLFDVADPTAMVDARTVSTVAPQALYLLNNPFVLEQAQALARRILGRGPDDRARIDYAYTLLYARPPRDEERQVGLDVLKNTASDAERQSAWEAYCQVLLCANEMIYVD